MSDPTSRLNAALQGRYRIERELGEVVWMRSAPNGPSQRRGFGCSPSSAPVAGRHTRFGRTARSKEA